MKIIKEQTGFSYIDVMIALVILLVGVLAAAGALGANMLRSYEAEKLILAKQLSLSSMESIFSAREIRPAGAADVNARLLSWQSIGNVGSNSVGGVPQGIFVSGFRPIRANNGADGIIGTADDACPSGSPCTVGAYSNTSSELKGFERRITVVDINDPERPTPPYDIGFRRIDVTIRYQINGLLREYTTSSMISTYQ